MTTEIRAHPWMANSAPGALQAMLDEIGAASVAEVFEQIPADHFRKTPLELPPALDSEIALKSDLVGKLKKNADCETNLSFLGAGVWQHHVPAIVDEIVEDARLRNSPMGYFPALYRMVTIRVKEGIERGDFEDGPRMEKLDVVFAGRYLDAYSAWMAGEPVTDSWYLTTIQPGFEPWSGGVGLSVNSFDASVN